LKTYKNSLRGTIIRHLLLGAYRRGEPTKLAYAYIAANYFISESSARKILAAPTPPETSEDRRAAEQLANKKVLPFDPDFEFKRVSRYPHGRGLFLHMQQFPTEEHCIQAIDVCCNYCGSYDAARLKRPRYWRCQDCGRRFNTVRGAHLPLRKWLAAQYLVKVSKGVITVSAMAKLLGVKRTTATRILRGTKEGGKILMPEDLRCE
jgi:transposase-like protein